MTVTISAAQRSVIYDDVVHDLSGVGDIFIYLEQNDAVEAKRLSHQFEADMRLLDDLGWDAEDPRPEFELTMPTAELQRVLVRLSAIALRSLGHPNPGALGALFHFVPVPHTDSFSCRSNRTPICAF